MAELEKPSLNGGPAIASICGVDVLASEVAVLELLRKPINPIESAQCVDAMKDIELVLYLEMAEMQRRLDDPSLGEDWKAKFKQKRIAFSLAAGWIRDVRLSSLHPGQGGHSACTRHFNENGHLSSISSLEYLASHGIEVPADLIAWGQVRTVG